MRRVEDGWLGGRGWRTRVRRGGGVDDPHSWGELAWGTCVERTMWVEYLCAFVATSLATVWARLE